MAFFPQKHFETNVHRSHFWAHCVILQAPLAQVGVSLIIIPSMPELGPIHSKHLIHSNQMSDRVNVGRVVIPGETKRDGDGHESIEKCLY